MGFRDILITCKPIRFRIPLVYSRAHLLDFQLELSYACCEILDGVYFLASWIRAVRRVAFRRFAGRSRAWQLVWVVEVLGEVFFKLSYMLTMLLDELWQFLDVSRDSSTRERGCRSNRIDKFSNTLIRSMALWDIIDLKH